MSSPMSQGASPSVVARAGTLEGSYLLERRLGAGGMGEVWLGRHVVSSGVGAVKLLNAKLAGSADAAALFSREQSALLRLSHPHVVPVFEVSASHIAMAYVDGTSLARRLRAGITPSLAFRVARQVASALAHAHRRGVLHLDVKPSNILMDGAGNAFLADFGASFLLEEAEGDVAPPVAGTPAYIAPERAAGEKLGEAADQFALGRTLVAALLGTERLPVWGKEVDALPPTIPPGARAIIARAIAIDPKDRFASLTELEDALAACDVEGLAPHVALLPLSREEAAYAWADRFERTATMAPEIARADYHLDTLEQTGALSPAAIAAFRERTGLSTTGFSLFGHMRSFGAKPGAGWVTRARHLVVLLTGYAMAREAWSDIALAIVRDNPDTLVATVDHSGFGESRFAESPPSWEHIGYAPIARMILTLVETLGLAELPTVFLGHSMAGTGLMAMPDEAMGPQRARIILTPMFRSLSLPPFRRRFAAVMMAVLGVLLAPKFLYRAFIRGRFASNKHARLLTGARRQSMFEEAAGLPVRTHTRLAASSFRLDPPPGEGFRRTYFVVGKNDPEARPEICARACRLLGIRPDRLRWLASGYHYPHLDTADDPAGTARNVHELVLLVDEALDELSPNRGMSTELAETEVATPQASDRSPSPAPKSAGAAGARAGE